MLGVEKNKKNPRRRDALLMILPYLLLIPCVGASWCDAFPRFHDCGENACCTSAVPTTCPPALLAEVNMGSMVCSAKCCDSGLCSGDTWSEAISVDDGGVSSVLEPYRSGQTSRRGGPCWFWVRNGCIGDGTCGIQYNRVVTKLNEEDQSHPIVKALNDVVSSILTITAVEIEGLLYWQHTIDTSEVRKVLDDNLNSLTWDDMRALQNGGEFKITWGLQLSVFNTVKTPDYDIEWTAKNGDEVCFHAGYWKGARPFAYTNRTVLFTECVLNCNDDDDGECPDDAPVLDSSVDDANGAAFGARGRATWRLLATTTAAIALAGFIVPL